MVAGTLYGVLSAIFWIVPRKILPERVFGKRLTTVAVFLPVVFLAVAAFLLNVVLSRIISVQRTQVAAMKAVGYSNRDVALHYTKLALVVAFAGGVIPKEEVFVGFGHPATVIIALVLIVSHGLYRSGAIEVLARHLVDASRALALHIAGMSAIAAAVLSTCVP